ncbi:hypothetical protein [Salinigranum sp. GCM10025319]
MSLRSWTVDRETDPDRSFALDARRRRARRVTAVVSDVAAEGFA